MNILPEPHRRQRQVWSAWSWLDLAFLIVLHLSLARGAYGRELVLSPDPAAAPVIGPALEAAAPGDVIRLRKGLYREAVTITKALSLVGEEGAVLDASESLRLDWMPAAELGKGVFRAVVDRRPRVLCLEGKVIAEIDERRKETQAQGPWFWKTLLTSKSGKTSRGFTGIDRWMQK